MPLHSARQEVAMMINSPEVWRKWVRKYGHYPGFKASLRKNKRRSKKRRKKRS